MGVLTEIWVMPLIPVSNNSVHYILHLVTLIFWYFQKNIWKITLLTFHYNVCVLEQQGDYANLLNVSSKNEGHFYVHLITLKAFH